VISSATSRSRGQAGRLRGVKRGARPSAGGIGFSLRTYSDACEARRLGDGRLVPAVGGECDLLFFGLSEGWYRQRGDGAAAGIRGSRRVLAYRAGRPLLSVGLGGRQLDHSSFRPGVDVELGGDGAQLKQNTHIVVTGCPKAQKKKHRQGRSSRGASLGGRR
jgi:hypothetical protein